MELGKLSGSDDSMVKFVIGPGSVLNICYICCADELERNEGMYV